MANLPNNIGETIRANRIKLGYTQEYLANELHVSAQAISKWEKGLNMPDINLLIPLSKVLNIGVDQLLGGDRYAELNRAFQKALQLGDKIALVVCEDALAEFPDDKTFLYRRACTQLFLAKNHTERNLYLNRAIADFGRLCSMYPDFESAKSMLAEAYFENGDRDRAIEMAVKSNDTNQLARFIGGEEEIRFKQKDIRKKAFELCFALLNYNSTESIDAARSIVEKMMTCDSLLNANLICGLYLQEAKLSLQNGDVDSFKEKITNAYELAYETSAYTQKAKLDTDKKPLAYTSPLFDRIQNSSASIDELGIFLKDDLLKDSNAFDLKQRIVSDDVFRCRPLLSSEWRQFFTFCEEHINQGNYYNFGTGWDLTESQIDEIVRALINEPKYPGNGTAELWDINRKYVEELISKHIMTGYVAQYNGDIYAYCNCGDKDKYAAMPPVLRELSIAPEGAKVLSIMETMVANAYKDCGLEEFLLTETMRLSKKSGYTHAEIYPIDTLYIHEGDFEKALELYKKLGFEIKKDISTEYNRWYFMQKKL